MCFTLLAALAAGGANAARLAFVLGTIERPEGANEGDELAPGTVVRSGDDALVMVEHRWPSDIASRDCIQIAIFGYGEQYTVSDSGTPGRCQTTVPNLAALDAGQPFLTRETRYGDAKFDEPGVPGKVATSQQRWQAFDRWYRDAQRSFTGVVSAVRSDTIRLRSAASGKQREFRLDRSRIDSPVAVDTLLNQSVQLDYRGTGYKPLAVRVRPESAPGAPVVVKPIPRPPVIVDRPEPTEPQRPAEPRPAPPDPRKEASGPAEQWGCALDLHQGDTGTLQFQREGERLRGSIVVRDGSQQHPIAGTWTGDRIEFWRELSATSGQRFVGVAVAAGDNEARMAGRFANRYAGVWSADCRPGAAPEAGARSTGGLDVVLVDAGRDKIAVIKAVRAATGLGLRDAKTAVDSAPHTIRSGLSAEEAERLAAELERAGARVAIQPSR